MKAEVYRVAERHGVKVVVVSNSPIAVPRAYLVGGRPAAEPGSTSAGRPFIERVVVSAGMDAADDYIAERAAKVALARRLAVHLYWMMRQGWDYPQWVKFGSHAGQPGHRDGVQ